MGRPFTVALNVVASPVHKNIKYHNIHGEPATLCADLEADKKIHHALQMDQEEGKTMEFNVTYLRYQIQNMNLCTPRRD